MIVPSGSFGPIWTGVNIPLPAILVWQPAPAIWSPATETPDTSSPEKSSAPIQPKWMLRKWPGRWDRHFQAWKTMTLAGLNASKNATQHKLQVISTGNPRLPNPRFGVSVKDRMKALIQSEILNLTPLKQGNGQRTTQKWDGEITTRNGQPVCSWWVPHFWLVLFQYFLAG